MIMWADDKGLESGRSYMMWEFFTRADFSIKETWYLSWYNFGDFLPVCFPPVKMGLS